MKTIFMKTTLTFSKAYFLLLSMTVFAEAEEVWDITNTGEPHKTVSFTVNEGTWMSVDISPDGRTLVFDMLGDIFRMPATGGEATLVHGGPAMQRKPRFSPDGSKILYLSDASGSDNLWLSNVDGSAARKVSQESLNALTSPSWGAKGKYAVAVKHYAEWNKIASSELWLFHLDGGAGRLLVGSPAAIQAVHEPQLSPDGQYLYYTQNISAGGVAMNALQANFAIKRRRLADGKTDEVIRGSGSATTVQISPNGKRLSFIRRVKEKTVLFVYDTETGEQRPVYDQLDHDLQNAWSPRSGGYYPQYNWFPDGQHVAIWARGKLQKINMDTQLVQEIPFQLTSSHKITTPPRFENTLAPESFPVRAIQHIAPSPDGKTVVFNALGRLWQKGLPEGKPKRLTKATGFEFEPAYSFDGKMIAYTAWDDERGSALNTMTAKGRKIKTLVKSTGVIRQPSFSRDGKYLTYRIQRGNKRMGGYRSKPGLYWVSVKTGETHYVGIDGNKPQFSSDGQRIYYMVADSFSAFGDGFYAWRKLESVRLDGLDKQEHATGTNITDIRFSPDQKWIAFKENQQYFIVPYRETGSSMTLMSTNAAVPVASLTQQGGYELNWSADSGAVYWLLGEKIRTTAVAASFSKDHKPVISSTSIGLNAMADNPMGMIAFTGGRVITMEAEQVIEKGTVLVERNRIVAVGPSHQVNIPRQARIIDITGKTIMPGFVDMHGHLDYDFVGLSMLAPQKRPSHYAAAAHGITMNFDPGSSELPAYASTEMNLAGITVGPRQMNSGKLIFGQKELSYFTPVNSLEDARNIMARKQAMGGVFIKSYMQPTRAKRQQLIKAAREAKMMVTPEGEAHFYNNISMILDGHISIEHGIQLANYYDDVIQLVARSETSLNPTLGISSIPQGENYFYQTTRPWDNPKVKLYVQEAPVSEPPFVKMIGRHTAKEIWDADLLATARSLTKLDAAGGVVTTGGHGQLQGLNLHWEMWAYADGGMSNHRVLRAATMNGAKTIALDKQIGSLKVGKLADIIVLDDNPLENIRNTNSVRYTMINGRLYDSLSMNEIGNYDNPRAKFFWELEEYNGIDWNESWSGN